jgi:two-component system, LytTR family, sensor kinase
MSHPFTSQRKALFIYSFIWLLVALLNAAILQFNLGFSIRIALTEGILGSTLFGLLGLIIWYPTTYIPVRKETPVYSVLAHMAAGVIIIVLWLSVTVGVLRALFSEDAAYVEYLSASVFMRAFTGVMVYLVLVLIYYLVSYARSLKDRARAEQKLRTLVRESELNMLKSQINPHFLFNSLNSISSLIMTNPEEAREMVVRLSDLLRYSLKHRESEFVSLSEELIRMKDYLSIEKIRFGDKLHYQLNAGRDCKQIRVPTMILQPLIENAIKHGVYESLEPVSIEFNCSIANGFLKMELKNDYDPDQPSQRGTGVGLQNVSDRIRLAYEGKGAVSIGSSNGIFVVTLSVPIEKTTSQ